MSSQTRRVQGAEPQTREYIYMLARLGRVIRDMLSCSPPESAMVDVQTDNCGFFVNGPFCAVQSKAFLNRFCQVFTVEFSQILTFWISGAVGREETLHVCVGQNVRHGAKLRVSPQQGTSRGHVVNTGAERSSCVSLGVQFTARFPCSKTRDIPSLTHFCEEKSVSPRNGVKGGNQACRGGRVTWMQKTF